MAALYTHSILTLAEAKATAGLDTNVSTYDASDYHVILNAVTDAIERFIGRRVKERGSTITEYHDGMGVGHRKLFPRHWPVDAVTSIHDDNNRDYGASTLIGSSHYLIASPDRQWIDLAPKSGGSGNSQTHFAKGIQNIKLVYSAGYGGTNTPATPEDLKQAAAWTFIHWLELSKSDATGSLSKLGVTAQGREGDSVSYLDTGMFPKPARMILERYQAGVVL